MRYFRFGILAVLLMVLFFWPALPATAARFIGGANVTINRPIDDDVYISGGEIELANDIDGDLAVAGGNVRIKGRVTGDLFVAGGTVVVEGNIGHTVRVAGGTVDFRGRIGRDLMAAGGTVVLDRQSAITGDAIAAGGTFKASGLIKGDIRGGFGNAELRGPIGGDVDVSVDRLTVAEGARIRGDLDYRSSNKAAIHRGAKISGKVRRHIPPRPKVEPLTRIFAWLWSLLSMLAVGLVVAWLFPSSLMLTKEALAKQPWASLGIGFAALILVPVASVMILLTVIGVPLALIGLALYIVSLYLAQIYAATALGSLALNRGGERWIGAGAALGIAVLSIVKLVPVVGSLATFFLIVFSLGAMIIAIWQARRGGA